MGAGAKTALTVIVTIGAMLVLFAAGSVVVMYSGIFDVAATRRHHQVVEWALNAAKNRSVARRARGIPLPPPPSAARERAALRDFENLCVACHGAPGVAPSEIGKGLYPPAPELSDAAEDLSLPEIYWIIAHGIRDTGMPAFRVTRSEEALWTLAFFVKGLVGMSWRDYQQLREGGGALQKRPARTDPESATPAKAPPTAPVEAGGEAARPELSGVLDAGVRTANIRAKQFEYIPNKIVVRQGEKVRLEVTSEDVTHGFGIAEYDIERTLAPHETQIIEFTADEAGTFAFFCTVFCGSGHMGMRGELVVVPATN